MTDWEKCHGRHAWGTRRKNDSGALCHDFKNRAAGKGACFREKEKFAFRQVRVSHGLNQRQPDTWEGLRVPVRLPPWGTK